MEEKVIYTIPSKVENKVDKGRVNSRMLTNPEDIDSIKTD